MTRKVTQVDGKASDLLGWIETVRKEYPNGYGYYTLREFDRVQLDLPVSPADMPEEVPAPGLLVEGVRVTEAKDMDMSMVEVTVWGWGEMQVLSLSPDTKIVTFKVEEN